MTWIDTDAGLDDAIAIIMAMRCLDLRGVSCTYGNCPRHMVHRNVQRILSVFHAQYPDVPLPKIALSAESSSSRIVRKPTDRADVDCWHGKDGLGDRPDFERENQIASLELPLVDFEQGVRDTIAELKKEGKQLTMMPIGPMTAVAYLLDRGVSDFNVVMMACAFPELLPHVNSPGNMATFGQPYCEHNIACDVEAAAKVFSSDLKGIIVDWNFTLYASIQMEELAQIVSHQSPLSQFYGEIAQHLKQQLIKAGRKVFACCDSCATYACIAGREHITLSPPGRIEVDLTDTQYYGRTIHHAEPQGAWQVLLDYDRQEFVKKLDAIMGGLQ